MDKIWKGGWCYVLFRKKCHCISHFLLLSVVLPTVAVIFLLFIRKCLIVKIYPFSLLYLLLHLLSDVNTQVLGEFVICWLLGYYVFLELSFYVKDPLSCCNSVYIALQKDVFCRAISILSSCNMHPFIIPNLAFRLATPILLSFYLYFPSLFSSFCVFLLSVLSSPHPPLGD